MSHTIKTLTDPWVRPATIMGTRHPGMVANMFVVPIKTPAKLLAMSTWLERRPENIAPKAPTATTSRKTTAVESQPEKQIATKQEAGTKVAT